MFNLKMLLKETNLWNRILAKVHKKVKKVWIIIHKMNLHEIQWTVYKRSHIKVSWKIKKKLIIVKGKNE